MRSIRNPQVVARIAFAIIILLCSVASMAASITRPASTEPNMEEAFTWWVDLPDIWTPVGWKDHLFQYNIMWNGTIIAYPDLNTKTQQKYGATHLSQGQGVQLEFFPNQAFNIDMTYNVPRHTPPRDDNSILQGWYDSDAPVLWSEWGYNAILLRQEVFAHIPGGQDTETGDEPLFLWVRLKVHDTCETLRYNDRVGFVIKINQPHIGSLIMAIRNSSLQQLHMATYPRELSPETEAYNPSTGFHVLEPDGRVRLAVAPEQDCIVEYRSEWPSPSDTSIYVQFDARKGSYVDLLVPMLPTERDIFDKELALGYDRALAEANQYWSKKPETAATFLVPEEHINQTIKHTLKFSEVIAERDPDTGITSMLSGSWMYAALWATPSSMMFNLVLDPLGYHSIVRKYISMFKDEQGTVTPPGDHFEHHPGYLSTPKSLTSVDWLTDHGAILTAICDHAMITGDREFIDEWTPTIIKACEWIQYARRINPPGFVEGILPPGVHTDAGHRHQAIWNDGWNYKGLITAVRLLKSIDHPRASEFETEAEDYKKAFNEALRTKTTSMRTWTDNDGNTHHLVPLSNSHALSYEYGIDFTYLDVGPLFLVYSELMDADDDLMKSTLLWFREGPPKKFYRYDSNNFLLPSLHREISSAELCYSWNVFHSWQLGDRPKYLEAMYSLFAANVSRKTFSACEARGGNHGTTFGALPIALARLAVIDDKIRDGELHLMRFMPNAWLKTDFESRFENMATIYGPVSLRAKLDESGEELHVSFSHSFRAAPEKIILHIPPVKGLKTVILNGTPLEDASGPVVISDL